MATVVTDNTVTNGDGSTVRTITYDDGSKSVQFTPGPGTPAANRDALGAKAVAAIATNITYINLAAPSTAQNTAEIKALAKQVNALIKLQLGLLDDTTGT